jgi:DNA-binding NarL/FixJ family response regulator
MVDPSSLSSLLPRVAREEGGGGVAQDEASAVLTIMALVRTLLVDDSPEFLGAAVRFLAADPQIEVVGFALSARKAIDEVTRLQPDLVLMDVAMPEMNGFAATRQIKGRPNPPRVIVLTLYDNDEYRAQAQAVGADGFVAKSEFGTQLLPLIRTLYQPPVH